MTTALYLRISTDDPKNKQNNSIINQRDLLQAYIAADPVLRTSKTLIFADQGYTGTNFNRPQVAALLALASRGGVQTILVKEPYVKLKLNLAQLFFKGKTKDCGTKFS